MRDLNIRMNHMTAGPCAICEAAVLQPLGPALCDGMIPVCATCGMKFAPELAAILKLAADAAEFSDAMKSDTDSAPAFDPRVSSAYRDVYGSFYRKNPDSDDNDFDGFDDGFEIPIGRQRP